MGEGQVEDGPHPAQRTQVSRPTPLMRNKGCEEKYIFQKILSSDSVFFYESGMVMRIIQI